MVANSIPQVTHLKRISLLRALAMSGVAQLLSLLSHNHSTVFFLDEYLGSGPTKRYSANTKSKNTDFDIGEERHQGQSLVPVYVTRVAVPQDSEEFNISNRNSDCCPTNEAMSTELCVGPLGLADSH
jgi:hypothetical protein